METDGVIPAAAGTTTAAQPEPATQRQSLRQRAVTLLHDPVTLAIVATTLIAAGLRTYYLSRPGHLLGLTEYDDGPYFGSAVRLTQGILPYRDFVLVQPPGITLLMLPAALLAKVTGTAWGLAIGRILTAAAGAAGVVLMGLLIRHRGFFATVVACGVVAVFPDSVAAAHTVLVEPWLVLFCLLGLVLVFDGDRLRSGRRLVWGGVAFGFAGAVEGWAIVPVLVVLVLCIADPLPGQSRFSRAWRFAAGVAGGFLVPVLPFATASPGGFYQSLVTAQVGPRAGSLRVPLLDRLYDLTGLSAIRVPVGSYTGTVIPQGHVEVNLLVAHLAVPTTVLVWGMAAILVLLVVGVPAVLNFVTREAPTSLEWLGLATVEMAVAMFLWPDQFHYHFAAFMAPFLGLGLALPLSRVFSRPVHRQPALPSQSGLPQESDNSKMDGAGLGQLPSRRRLAAVARRLPVTATAVAVTLVAVGTFVDVTFESLPYSLVGQAQIVAADRDIPAGACVLSDNVTLLLLANRFTSDVPGCGVIDDGLGSDLALSHGLTPTTGAGQVAAVQHLWQQAFDHAQYVWITPHYYRRIPFDTWPAGYSYMRRNFRMIMQDNQYDQLWRRDPQGA
ncbi:MAG TPA: hypothetical protein VGS19_16080 [Streptosporangiaceae bacterium]|nr:hypothetical protein [Streptosporangiaceae bacterium]